MRIAGIDPGISGGVGLIEAQAPFALASLVACIDIPTVGEGAKRRVDASALARWITANKPDIAFIERAQAMPKQGSSSGFLYGRAVGAVEATFLCMGVPVQFVEASMWKKRFNLRGKDKEAARQMAIHAFPKTVQFERKKDHNRAESVLIALYGAELPSATRPVAA